VALPIAERFELPLTVVYARKLTAPVAPELAFGAIDEDGKATLDPETVTALRLGPEDIEEATALVRKEIERRMVWYGAPPLAHYLPGATVVLVDDGLATGLTLRAALAYARRHGARQVVVATPCASAGAGEFFRREADHFVSLVVDEQFQAVGQYYRDFSPVHDDEVLAMLARAEQHRRRAAEADSALGISFSNERGWRHGVTGERTAAVAITEGRQAPGRSGAPAPAPPAAEDGTCRRAEGHHDVRGRGWAPCRVGRDETEGQEALAGRPR
jgi:predicted phosphoribosyltransferase